MRSILVTICLVLAGGLTGCKKGEAPYAGIDRDPGEHPVLLLSMGEEEQILELIVKA